MNYKIVFFVISVYMLFNIFFYKGTIGRNLCTYQIGQVSSESVNKKSHGEYPNYDCNSIKYGDAINITEKNIILSIILYIMGFCYYSRLLIN